MSKVIKFNLIVDGQSIRTLSDLRANFNVDDVYELYRSGVLKKWLDVRGYEQESMAIKTLSKGSQDDPFVLIPQLIKIFVEIDEANLNRYTQNSYATVLKLFNAAQIQESVNNEFKQEAIIRRYHSSYEELKKGIKSQTQNFNFVKSYLRQIETKYAELFKLDYKNFFELYQKEDLLVILLVLSNEYLRKIWLEDEEIRNKLKKLQYNEQTVGPHLQTFSKSTGGMWKYLGDGDKKYMVVHLKEGTYSVGKQSMPGKDYFSDEINGHYLILDGLLFKSTSESSYPNVVYMEV